MKNIYIDTELVLPMYNVHPYFSLKNVGKKVCMYTAKYGIPKLRSFWIKTPFLYHQTFASGILPRGWRQAAGPHLLFRNSVVIYTYARLKALEMLTKWQIVYKILFSYLNLFKRESTAQSKTKQCITAVLAHGRQKARWWRCTKGEWKYAVKWVHASYEVVQYHLKSWLW